jgi:hypothetical protein
MAVSSQRSLEIVPTKSGNSDIVVNKRKVIGSGSGNENKKTKLQDPSILKSRLDVPDLSEDSHRFAVQDNQVSSTIESNPAVSFTGKSRFLASAKDAVDIAVKIRETVGLRSIELSGNSVGIGAAKAIAKAMISQNDLAVRVPLDYLMLKLSDVI